MKKRILFAGREGSRSWFWWGINIGVFLALIAWWWLQNQAKDRDAAGIKVERLVLPPDDEPAAEPQVTRAAHVPLEPEPETPDNLQAIEGIGPRSAQVLREAGILTFASLAAMEPDAIRDILRAAGVRVPYPGTWPEQAALAAAGEWEALKELQDGLVGGRRI